MTELMMNQGLAWNMKLGRLADQGFSIEICKNSDKTLKGEYYIGLNDKDGEPIDGMFSDQIYAGISYLYEKWSIFETHLCYVANNVAYFTTIDLKDQWGDDWNDVPYEHNAGLPYDSDGEKSWKIFTVEFDGPFVTPRDGWTNSPYSVEVINKCHVPWLKTKEVEIFAGCSIKVFEMLIKSGEGTIKEN